MVRSGSAKSSEAELQFDAGGRSGLSQGPPDGPAYRILGPIEVWAGGRRLTVAGRQQRLLAFLLLHANRAVSRDAITDAVWDEGDAGSGKRVAMAVARLRQALAPLSAGEESVLVTVTGGYRLVVSPSDLDIERFEALMNEGRDLLDRQSPDPACARLSEALAMWRGPALAEVAYDDFAQGEVRRLDELRLAALEARIEADLRRGQPVGLVGELEALVVAHPTRERFVHQLMLALYRGGRQAEALEAYQRLRVRLSEELGLEPSPTITTLQCEILEHAPRLSVAEQSSAREGIAGRLPVAPTPMLGREGDIAALSRLLVVDGCRLVTLTGPGGVGKTRLALTAARAVEDRFADGVSWVELVGVASAEEVPAAMVRAAETAPGPGETAMESLSRGLARGSRLLVIDNFEHVLDAAPVIAQLHRSCPQLVMLVTSREALDVEAEDRYQVSPLGLPDSAATEVIQAAPACAMFVAGVKRHDHTFALSSDTAVAVSRICTRLDGLPLALELAAGRTDLMSVDELAVELDAAIAASGSGHRDAPSRHQTLTATVDWSYQLLDGEQKSAFSGCAVFAGGASLNSVERVVGCDRETVRALVAKSLLQRRTEPTGETRLGALEMVREYASVRLGERPDEPDVRQRHLEHYLTLAEQQTARLFTHDDAAAVLMLDDEIDNILAALQWSLTAAPAVALRLAGAVGRYWVRRSDPSGLDWLDAALAAAGPDAKPADRGRVFLRRVPQLGTLRWQTEASVHSAEQAAALYRAAGDPAGLGEALVAQGVAVSVLHGNEKLGRPYCEEAIALARDAGADNVLGIALGHLAADAGDDRLNAMDRAAVLLRRVGNFFELARYASNAAFVALTESAVPDAFALLAMARDALTHVASPMWSQIVLNNTGLAHVLVDEPEPAAECFTESLQLERDHAYRFADETFVGISALAAAQRRETIAARLLGAARAAGYPPAATEARLLAKLERHSLTAARQRSGPQGWEAAEQAGARLSFEEALTLATEETSRIRAAARQTAAPASSYPPSSMPDAPR